MRYLLLAAMALISTPAVADDDICPDRPLKGTASCTVPQGHFQIEVGALDWSRAHDAGSTTYDVTVSSPLIKYGLTGSMDLELGLTPVERQVTHEGSMRSVTTGVGDSEVRLKRRLTSQDAGVGVALVPWMKLPTAHGELGNGKFEQGLILPVDVKLPGEAQLNFSPEVDRLANGDGRGFHAQLVSSAALTVPIADKWSVGGELWMAHDFDPDGHVHQASADAALSFTPDTSTQLDMEADVGLNHATPSLELQLGFSRRF